MQKHPLRLKPLLRETKHGKLVKIFIMLIFSDDLKFSKMLLLSYCDCKKKPVFNFFN